MSDLPIGIFDSGIGGLTVARKITNLMPQERIIYFGDTLHLPYGEKSKKKIQQFSLEIVHFLIKKKCKAIIIACNSASSFSMDYLTQRFADHNIIIFNVIDPIINYIKKLKFRHQIGIIGTRATIKSGIYEKKICDLEKNHSVVSLETPLLAPMIEANFYNESIKMKIINSYINDEKLKNIDSLVLGCTHYPLIENQINNIYKSKVKIINSLQFTTEEVIVKLKKENLLSTKKNKKKHEFFVSDLTESFQESAKLFFNKKIILKEKNIFNLNDTI